MTTLFLTLLMFVGLGWQAWHSYNDFKTAQVRDLRLQELSGIIIHLDEVLTMSARMGATTGDLKWEKRYLGFEPQLDAAIKEARKLAPESFMSETVAKTDAANIKLVIMEKQAFELVHQGQRKAAFELLSSKDYEEQKRIYNSGMKQFDYAMHNQVMTAMGHHRWQALLAVIVVFVALPILFSIWYYTIKMMRRYIIERDCAENALKESEEKHRKLIETAQDAIICIDEKGKVIVWNQSAEKIFGYTKSEITGLSIEMIIPEKHKNWHQKGMERFLKTGETRIIGKAVELSGKTKEGIEIPIELALSFQKKEDERYIFTGIIRDITVQKRAKEQLIKKSKELKNANKELEEFIYIISHDLKEPLFVIEGYMSRLSSIYKDIIDNKGKLYINRTRANANIMNQKIHEVLEVLKVGRVIYDYKNNDIGVIVNDVVKTLENKMAKNKTNIIIQDNLPSVLCDERRMKDVLSNLLTNSIKFIGNHNHRQVRIGCDKNGGYYKFYVEDTGIGIQEEYQEQIFNIFKRLNDIETEGTGVGLAIVKKIVEQHKGKIWVESPVSDGRGTRFCFTIPNNNI